MNVESQFMINRKPCSIYNLYSYFLHVITSHTMGEVLGKFHNSSDYDLKCTDVILSLC